MGNRSIAEADGRTNRFRRLPANRMIALPIILAMTLVTACGGPATPPLAKALLYCAWPEDQVISAADAFTQETGVKVILEGYGSQEEAIETMRAHSRCDLVVMGNEFIPSMVHDNLLAKLDFRNLSNFKNISPNFRNLAYDPDNAHAVPYSWGTAGLVVRSDLVDEPVTRWADLWDPRYAGRVVMWLSTPRQTLGTALMRLGHSINTVDPAQLEAALQLLLPLKPNAIWLDEEESSASRLVSGEAVMALGWALDVRQGREQNPAIAYVLPQEGAMVWGDNFVIPAASPNRYTAELFLNFLLRPEITAQIIHKGRYAMPNDGAIPLVDPEMRGDPVIYPSNEQMRRAQLMLPLSPEGESLYQAVWDRFLAAGGQ
jgi:spermidine/putrescine transport system substrate-binding protein